MTPQLFLILQHRPGDIVELTIERDGRERVIEAQLASWADLPQPEEQREG
jgi:S1-C subfamily serine protease